LGPQTHPAPPGSIIPAYGGSRLGNPDELVSGSAWNALIDDMRIYGYALKKTGPVFKEQANFQLPEHCRWSY
jgi:hypothetical protein